MKSTSVITDGEMLVLIKVGILYSGKMNKKDIIEEACKRYPSSKPMNYITEGKKMGFVEGALWMKTLQKTEKT